MFGEITLISLQDTLLNGAYSGQIPIVDKYGDCCGHTAHEIVLPQSLFKLAPEHGYHRPVLGLKQFHHLAFAHRFKELKERERIQVHEIHLAHGEGVILMHGYSQQRACCHHMVLWSFLGKVLQRRDTSRCLLYLVQNDECILVYGDSRAPLNGVDDAWNIEVRGKHPLEHLVILKVDIRTLLISLACKLAHQPGLAHLSGSQHDQRLAPVALFPVIKALDGTSFHNPLILSLSHITKVHLLSHISKSRAENVGIFTKVIHIM